MNRFVPLLATTLAVAAMAAAPPQSFDILIRNGRVLDGSGNPWVRADVGIRGDRVVAVGRLTGATATTVVDARERFVAPGVLDAHSHAVGALGSQNLREGRALLAQGLTLVVGNPDGGGPVDLKAQAESLTAAGPGLNIALVIGHASVRRAVLGQNQRRDPTAEEL